MTRERSRQTSLSPEYHRQDLCHTIETPDMVVGGPRDNWGWNTQASKQETRKRIPGSNLCTQASGWKILKVQRGPPLYCLRSRKSLWPSWNVKDYLPKFLRILPDRRIFYSFSRQSHLVTASTSHPTTEGRIRNFSFALNKPPTSVSEAILTARKSHS